jgi:hypothetical protein
MAEEAQPLGGCIWGILLVCACSLGVLLWPLLPDRPAGASFPVFKKMDTWLEVTVSSEMGSLLSDEDNSYSTVEIHYTKLGGWLHQSERVQVDSFRTAGIHGDWEVSFQQQAGDSLAPIYVLLPGRENAFEFTPPVRFPNISIQKRKQAIHYHFPLMLEN